MTIEFGLVAKSLAEQLAEYNLPQQRIAEFQAIANFIVCASFGRKIGDKQVEKLNALLGHMIAQEIKNRRTDNGADS